jgi:hypothetical protein
MLVGLIAGSAAAVLALLAVGIYVAVSSFGSRTLPDLLAGADNDNKEDAEPGAGGPAPALAIKPAPFEGERVTVRLPAAVQSVCVGGGGRYLILHLPQQRKLAVFDANAAKVVKYLPVAEDNVLFTAGLDKLIVALPNSNVLQRWDLGTFERDVTVPAPMPVKALAMGSGTRAPLVVMSAEGQGPWDQGRVVCLDPRTFKEGDYQIRAGGNPFFGDDGRGGSRPLRVSTNGQVIAGSGGVYVREGKTYRGVPAPGSAVPAPDGRILFTTGQLYTAEGKPIGEHVGGHGHMVWYVPAQHGPYYLSLNQVGDPGSGFAVGLHVAGDTRRLCWLPNVEAELNTLIDWQTGQWQPFEEHVFFLPEAKLLLIHPGTNDKLVLVRVDVERLLDRSGIDYLFVPSLPPPQFQPGKTYSYRTVVRSRKGGVKYKLESGPPGMKVAADGKLTWSVPKDFADNEVDVILTVGDASGQEIFHTFKIVTK